MVTITKEQFNVLLNVIQAFFYYHVKCSDKCSAYLSFIELDEQDMGDWLSITDYYIGHIANNLDLPAYSQIDEKPTKLGLVMDHLKEGTLRIVSYHEHSVQYLRLEVGYGEQYNIRFPWPIPDQLPVEQMKLTKSDLKCHSDATSFLCGVDHNKFYYFSQLPSDMEVVSDIEQYSETIELPFSPDFVDQCNGKLFKSIGDRYVLGSIYSLNDFEPFKGIELCYATTHGETYSQVFDLRDMLAALNDTQLKNQVKDIEKQLKTYHFTLAVRFHQKFDKSIVVENADNIDYATETLYEDACHHFLFDLEKVEIGFLMFVFVLIYIANIIIGLIFGALILEQMYMELKDQEGDGDLNTRTVTQDTPSKEETRKITKETAEPSRYKDGPTTTAATTYSEFTKEPTKDDPTTVGDPTTRKETTQRTDQMEVTGKGEVDSDGYENVDDNPSADPNKKPEKLRISASPYDNCSLSEAAQ
ncbi:unnamed protein product [Bursaphelenchus okinawaensis]|uniref:Uncharacterized protein n=1 Tax=Bursaphelenchus okinawaensis TaxID=465554 RepID=A0A811LQ60_9BILA|nr:unnamed protein product [Bursaphelenchus okinawaensis]CAG9127764.1 unnamed protein product [Bursaphelenchus okinawaensis]